MVKVWFPSMYLRLTSLKLNKSPPQAKLVVPPSMTKWEVKEYLTKLYNINILKVDTANYLGKFLAQTELLLIILIFYNIL